MIPNEVMIEIVTWLLSSFLSLIIDVTIFVKDSDIRKVYKMDKIFIGIFVLIFFVLITGSNPDAVISLALKGLEMALLIFYFGLIRKVNLRSTICAALIFEISDTTVIISDQFVLKSFLFVEKYRLRYIFDICMYSVFFIFVMINTKKIKNLSVKRMAIYLWEY